MATTRFKVGDIVRIKFETLLRWNKKDHHLAFGEFIITAINYNSKEVELKLRSPNCPEYVYSCSPDDIIEVKPGWRNDLCECLNLTSRDVGMTMLMGHHEQCPRRGNVVNELRTLIAGLISEMESSEIDTDRCPAYSRAKELLMQSDRNKG